MTTKEKKLAEIKRLETINHRLCEIDAQMKILYDWLKVEKDPKNIAEYKNLLTELNEELDTLSMQ